MSPTRGDVCALACAELFRGDGAIMASGMGPLPRLGTLLARVCFEPLLVITDGQARTLESDGSVGAWVPFRRVFDVLWRGRRHVLMGAAQIDQHGNQNISCIGPHARPKVQLLGVRGAPGNTVHHTTSYWVPRHSRRIFVPRVDMVSGVGTDRGAAEIRQVISNLAVMAPSAADGRLALVSLHPGVSLEEVRDQTGFDLEVPEVLPTTRIPNPDEAAWLERLDPGAAIRSTVS